MIPKILKIKGLYSYREEQVVDFSKLTDAGLFGIFGEVGSGKSTILEAIIFCIYEKSERLKSRENRNYNMMNLMMNESEIDFTFIAGISNQEYNINYKFGRNKKKFDEVIIRSGKFYKIENDIKIPVTNEEILEAVGLSYENFKMTVIIPQGKFRDFIELSNADRSNMLKELFRLHDFDLFDKVKKLENENTSLLDNKTGEIKAYQFVDENKIFEKKQLLNQLLQDLKSLSTEVTNLEKEIKEGTELKDNTFHLQGLETELHSLRDEENSIKDLEKELNEYVNIRNNFRDLYKEELEIKKNLENELKTKGEFLEKKSKIEEELKVLQADFKESQREYNTIERLRAEATEFEKLADYIDCKQEEIRFNTEMSELKKCIESLQTEIENQKKNKENAEVQIESLKNKLLPVHVITQVGKWISEKENEEKNIQQLQDKIDAAQGRLETIQKEYQNSIIGIDGLENCKSTEEADQFFLERKEKFQDELRLLQDEKTSLSIKQELLKHASHLEDGKPCMLCGSIHHPAPLQLNDYSDELISLGNKIQNIDQKLSSDLVKAKDVYGKIKSRIDLEKSIQESITEIDEKKSALNIHFSEIPYKEYDFKDENNFKIREKENQENLKSIEKMEAELKLVNEKISDLSLKIFEEEKKEVQVVANLKNAGQIISSLVSQIKNLDIDLYQNESADDLRTRKEEILRQINSINSAFHSASELLRDKESEKSELDGSLNIIFNKIAEEEPKLVLAQNNIKEKLAELNLNYDLVYDILIKKLDESAINTKINDFKQKVAGIKSEINSLIKKIGGRSFDPDSFSKSEKKLEEIKDKRQLLSEQKGKLENEIEIENTNLTKKQHLQTEINALQVRKLDIGKLKSMFSGNGFVDFVSKRYLSNVVAIANKRFRKMVRQKYSLELKDGEIIVRDHMNEGKERSIKSLSGGQSFQAALSLALSLSENIQRNAGVDQHFFFLDEGFGSLDEDNLQIVFETLRGLQQENRIVGLISHVKALQQELDIHLLISNDEQHGSVIKCSWEN